MTAISITPGYPTFADTDGSPLNDGYVYIGLENQDPITAPTTAFWDKAFQIPADQPLRTSGGYVVRNGSPAAVYTGAAYSILVQNKNLVTVYNAPSAVITNVTNNVEEITQYQGAHATDPVARNDGTPLQTGDLYFNTVVNELKVWTGTVWVPAVPGTVTVENFTGTGAQTAFNLATAPVAENNTQIYIDGVYQQKDTYTLSGATINFSAAPPLNSTIEVVTFSISSLGTTDASNVSYNEGSAGAVNTSVQAKLQEYISVLDFGADSTGATDATSAIQAALDAAEGRPVYVPAGTYAVQSTITLTSYGTSTFRQGCQLIGDGIGKTIFDNQVSSGPMLNLISSGTAGNHFSMGAQLSGFNVIRTTAETDQIAIKIITSYMVRLEQIHINGMTGKGIHIPTILGDFDGSNMVTLNQVRIENCSGWGIDAVGDANRNELSFVQMNQVFIQACGTNDGLAIPTSGGMTWKGQIMTMEQCAFTICENVAFYVVGQAGLGQTVDLQSTTFENNNKKSVLVTGVKMFRGRNIQFYNNDGYTATNGIEFDASSFVISHVDLNGVVVRATSGNNAYTAFKISGANADLSNCSVQNVAWDVFDYGGQVRQSGFKDKPTALANKTSVQSVLNTPSAMIFNVDVSDIQDSYDITNGRYTVAYESIWNISGQLTMTSLDANADVVIYLYDVNATANIASVVLSASGNTTQSFAYDFTEKLGTTGALRSYEIRAEQSSSGSKALDVSSPFKNTFSARRLPTGEIKF